MAKLGGTLLLFGIGSMILNLLGLEFILLMWVDLWGPTIGWGIRIGMAVVGLILVVVGAATDSGEE
ncbi:hypothetical protein [Stratiformator vulcanicus]|uniref:DUF378 domain-containing protein n=1 Tax=Stratiformator vulcanicus TaxID=2527980 RepID=A0A517R3W0_9PLAN|nr:hypothetical protein [Stratiformator vulcanicus]QDT38530.1 hypothetical protein Pan189_29240 [Stratiformator vulcanicus]